MKKLLIIALLVVGCDRYEFKEATIIDYCGYTEARFDKWSGETENKIQGEWYNEEKWGNSAIYSILDKEASACRERWEQKKLHSFSGCRDSSRFRHCY